MKPMSFHYRLPLSLALTVTVLTACQTWPRPPATEASRPARLEMPALPEGRVFEVDRSKSHVRFVVYPDGPMARIGHPHVIGGTVVDGRVVLTEPFEDSALRLTIDVDALEVDRADWRRDEGFEAHLAEASIAATRRNLLSESLLNVADHPSIEIQSLSLRGPRWQPDITLRIALTDTARELTVPVALDFSADTLTATGHFTIRQSAFGIEPFTAAGGALRVADRVVIRFRIIARAKPADQSAVGDSGACQPSQSKRV